MKQAKAMRLVPDDIYQRLISGNLPPESTLSSSQQTMQIPPGDPLYDFTAVLNRPDLGKDEQCKLYLQRYHRSKEAQSILEKEKPPVKVQFSKQDDAAAEMMMEDQQQQQHQQQKQKKRSQADLSRALYFDKSHREKAARVLAFLEENSSIVQEKGLLKLDGVQVEGGNLIDLVNYLVSQSRAKPSGWDEFAKFLHTINMPQSLIVNAAARKQINSLSAVGHPRTPATGKQRNRISRRDLTEEFDSSVLAAAIESAGKKRNGGEKSTSSSPDKQKGSGFRGGRGRRRKRKRRAPAAAAGKRAKKGRGGRISKRKGGKKQQRHCKATTCKRWKKFS
jgi:hypothetical protein